MLKLPWFDSAPKSAPIKSIALVANKQNDKLPRSIFVVEDKEFAAQYDQLAHDIGVASRVSNKLRDYLVEQSIEIYDRVAVERYMDKKGHWSWFPLRHEDINHARGVSRETEHQFPTLYGGWDVRQYMKSVPYPVLLTVKGLVDHFHTEVAFFVGAIKTNPDPFLAVMLNSKPGQLFIIERWDEPSLRG